MLLFAGAIISALELFWFEPNQMFDDKLINMTRNAFYLVGIGGITITEIMFLYSTNKRIKNQILDSKRRKARNQVP